MVSPPPAALIRLTEGQNGALLTVKPGQAIQVRLPDPSPAGPDWSLTRGPPAVILVRRGFAPGARGIGPRATGVASADVIDLRVVAPPGRTVPLSFTYRLSSGRLAFAHVWQVRLRVVGPTV